MGIPDVVDGFQCLLGEEREDVSRQLLHRTSRWETYRTRSICSEPLLPRLHALKARDLWFRSLVQATCHVCGVVGREPVRPQPRPPPCYGLAKPEWSTCSSTRFQHDKTLEADLPTKVLPQAMAVGHAWKPWDQQNALPCTDNALTMHYEPNRQFESHSGRSSAPAATVLTYAGLQEQSRLSKSLFWQE